MPDFRAPDGASLAYDAYEPKTDNRRPMTILWVCGWSDHRTRWQRPAEALRNAGYAVYLLDQRGHGDSAGIRGHLSRFSQLLADLQAFRRLIRSRSDVPQVLLGHAFGALVVLRYLETQPSDPVARVVLSSPWLSLARPVPLLKRIAGRPLADLWPSLQMPSGIDARRLTRDAAVSAAYFADPAVHHVMTPGAWREIKWAERVVPADAHRIAVPLLFLLAGQDGIVDAERARAFANGLRGAVDTKSYPEMQHDLFLDTGWEKPMADVLEFLRR
ncbi:MAG TPA: alpha/beta fold hydrolase [Gemmatimonadales bacterium]|nr:alpha/beta fold hydrolase [Gemmatimonadales bacterium]